jgi:excisionase family DNA binding protein
MTLEVAEAPKRRARKGSDPASRLVPARQAARETGIPYMSLRDLAFEGAIPVLKLGRAWYFERSDLAKYIERRKELLTR